MYVAFVNQGGSLERYMVSESKPSDHRSIFHLYERNGIVINKDTNQVYKVIKEEEKYVMRHVLGDGIEVDNPIKIFTIDKDGYVLSFFMVSTTNGIEVSKENFSKQSELFVGKYYMTKRNVYELKHQKQRYELVELTA